MTPKISDSFSSFSVSGYPRPFSHLLTACPVVPSSSASASWEIPLSFRRLKIFSPIFIGKFPPLVLICHDFIIRGMYFATILRLHIVKQPLRLCCFVQKISTAQQKRPGCNNAAKAFGIIFRDYSAVGLFTDRVKCRENFSFSAAEITPSINENIRCISPSILTA